jgi:hypothetical protein
MKKILLLLFLLPLLQNCMECGPQRELTFSLSINVTDNKLNKITALGALNNDAFVNLRDSITTEFRDYREFQLPISLNADQTTYIFDFENRTDTLTLSYERLFYHQESCGFVVDVDDVKGKSTFSHLHVTAIPFVGERKGWGGHQGGIFVSAAL